ncbi:hypothetical protein EB796_023418 [Bugula neritina]|uniref:Uncharacterized protein n=1 Tax=Bugula neritina TaxID=10212 RepID=A0A7J7IXK1_BUGNE|nr:hypothetical protein EB796_023418 [Bugula neritina]
MVQEMLLGVAVIQFCVNCDKNSRKKKLFLYICVFFINSFSCPLEFYFSHENCCFLFELLLSYLQLAFKY